MIEDRDGTAGEHNQIIAYAIERFRSQIRLIRPDP
jgi:hypothetical protein